jgi:hypothetical protein
MGGAADLHNLTGPQGTDSLGGRAGTFAHRDRAVTATAARVDREGDWRAGSGCGSDGCGDLCTRRGGCRSLVPRRWRNARSGFPSIVTPDGRYDSDSSNPEQNHNRREYEDPLPRSPSRRHLPEGLCSGGNNSRGGAGSVMDIGPERGRVVHAECSLLESRDVIAGVGRRVSRSRVTPAHGRVGPGGGWKEPLCLPVPLLRVVPGIRSSRHWEKMVFARRGRSRGDGAGKLSLALPISSAKHRPEQSVGPAHSSIRSRRTESGSWWPAPGRHAPSPRSHGRTR